jgi:hypothetical protein
VRAYRMRLLFRGQLRPATALTEMRTMNDRLLTPDDVAQGVRQVERYLPLGFRGRMVMSYLGSVLDRSSRASTGRISAFVSVTPLG